MRLHPSSIFLALLVLAVVSFGSGFWLGYGRGDHDRTAVQDHKAVAQFESMLGSIQTEWKAASVESARERQRQAALQAANQKTTRELRDVLKKTSADRAGCRFDDDSVQRVQAARDAAASAAANGLRGAVPTPSGTE